MTNLELSNVPTHDAAKLVLSFKRIENFGTQEIH